MLRRKHEKNPEIYIWNIQNYDTYRKLMELFDSREILQNIGMTESILHFPPAKIES